MINLASLLRRGLLAATLVLAAGCDESTPLDGGTMVDASGPHPDLENHDFAHIVDLIPGPDVAMPVDLEVPPDLRTFVDMAKLRDLTVPDDLRTLADLAVPADIAVPDDLAVPSDLAVPVDMASLPDMAAPNDMAQPDFAMPD